MAFRKEPAYAFYQFFLNLGDAEVGKLLRFLTFLSLTEIQTIERQHAANPGAREAQRALAHHLTAFIHRDAKALEVEDAAAALFYGSSRRFQRTCFRKLLPVFRRPFGLWTNLRRRHSASLSFFVGLRFAKASGKLANC